MYILYTYIGVAHVLATDLVLLEESCTIHALKLQLLYQSCPCRHHLCHLWKYWVQILRRTLLIYNLSLYLNSALKNL